MSGETVTIKLLETDFDPERALGEFSDHCPGAGALASFLGKTRAQSIDGDSVEALFLQAYPGFTETAIEEICRKARERWALLGVLVIHRHGEMTPGQPIVLVAAAAAHRRDALAATEFLIDRLKTGAPFWKKEITASGARWIEPTKDDYARALAPHANLQGAGSARR